MNGIMKDHLIAVVQTLTEGSQTMFGWCKSVNAFTTADEMHSQKSVFTKLLDDGIHTMTSALAQIQDSSFLLSSAARELGALQQQFQNELESKSKELQSETGQKVIADYSVTLASSEKFYKYLKAKIGKAFRDISALKQQAAEIKSNATDVDDINHRYLVSEYRDDTIIQSAEMLVAKCNEFKTMDE